MLKVRKAGLFEYHPPLYGPRGATTKAKKEELAKLMPTQDVEGGEKEKEKVEDWVMSGGLGGGSQGPNLTNLTDGGDVRAAGDGTMFHRTAGDDADTVTALHTGIGQAQLDNLMEGTYPFETLEDFDFNASADSISADLDTGSFETGAVFPATAHDLEPHTSPMHPYELIPTTENLDMGLSQLATPEIDVAQESDFADITGGTNLQTSADATQTTSFNDVIDSILGTLQPGTQEVGETQMAERAMGEFEEGMERGRIGNDSWECEKVEQATNRDVQSEIAAGTGIMAQFGKPKELNMGKPALGGLDFGKSVLGKRKSGAAALQEKGVEEKAGTKKMKMTEVHRGDDEAALLDAQLNVDGDDEED